MDCLVILKTTKRAQNFIPVYFDELSGRSFPIDSHELLIGTHRLYLRMSRVMLSATRPTDSAREERKLGGNVRDHVGTLTEIGGPEKPLAAILEEDSSPVGDPMDISKFYVVAVISNPVRYKSRYTLYKKFEAEMKAANANLMTVEIAFGSRPFEVTEAGNPMNLQLRTWDEIWHKENMINLGIRRLPSDWEYVAWIDADVSFIRPDWITETVHQLQHYQVVQMFQNAIDLGPRGEALDTHNSFGWCWLNGKALQVNWKPYMIYPHTGFAWAARREAIDHLGGLIDTAILGAADHHMAWSLIGKGAQTFRRTSIPTTPQTSSTGKLALSSSFRRTSASCRAQSLTTGTGRRKTASTLIAGRSSPRTITILALTSNSIGKDSTSLRIGIRNCGMIFERTLEAA